jgi:hypothetical protein
MAIGQEGFEDASNLDDDGARLLWHDAVLERDEVIVDSGDDGGCGSAAGGNEDVGCGSVEGGGDGIGCCRVRRVRFSGKDSKATSGYG